MARVPVVQYGLDRDASAVVKATYEADAALRLETMALLGAANPRSAQFKNRGDAEAHFDWLVARGKIVGAPSGRATFHMCAHGDGEGDCTLAAAELRVGAF